MTHLHRGDKSNKLADISEDEKSSQSRKTEKPSARSDVTRKSEKSKGSSEVFILESSNSNSSVVLNAFKWDLNLSVEQNGLDQTS